MIIANDNKGQELEYGDCYVDCFNALISGEHAGDDAACVLCHGYPLLTSDFDGYPAARIPICLLAW